MKDITEFVKDIWKDAVWSKVISAAILAGAGLMLREIFSVKRKLQRVKKALNKGDAKRAAEMTASLLLNNPEGRLGAEILSVRGKAFIEQNDFKNALEAVEDAMQKQKYLADAYFVRGRAYSLTGKHKEAMDDFNKAETLATADKKDKMYVYLYRGIDYCVLGEFDKAIADFNKALSIKNCDHKILNNRGTVYYHWSQYDKAITDFTDALAVKPDFHEALCNRGNAYRHKGEHNKAITDYTDALAVKPKLLEALNGRGLSY